MNILKKTLAIALSAVTIGGTVATQIKAAPVNIVDWSGTRKDLVCERYSDGGQLYGYAFYATNIFGNATRCMAGQTDYYRSGGHTARVKANHHPSWFCYTTWQTGWATVTSSPRNGADYFEYDGVALR